MAPKAGRVSIRKQVHRRKGARRIADARRALQRESTGWSLQNESDKECTDSNETMTDMNRKTAVVCLPSKCMVNPCNSCLAEKQKLEMEKSDVDSLLKPAVSSTAQAQSAFIERVKQHLKDCKRRKLV